MRPGFQQERIINDRRANKAIVRQFIDEFWNERKLDLADDLFAPDCVTHQLRSDVEATGAPRTPESVKREAAAWLAGFPDLRFDVEQMIAEGDQVVTRCMMYGTHTSAWMGVAPPGNQVRASVFAHIFCRTENLVC